MAGSDATLGKTLGHGDRQTPGHKSTSATTFPSIYDLHQYNSTTSDNNTSNTSLALSMIQPLFRYNVTTPIAPLRPILLQHPLRLMNHTGTATITSLCSLLIQHHYIYDLHCYNTYNIFTIYKVPTTITSL